MPVPMMSVYWKGDEIISPKEDSQLIARSSMDGDIVEIKKEKPLYKGLEQALTKSADWIYAKLI